MNGMIVMVMMNDRHEPAAPRAPRVLFQKPMKMSAPNSHSEIPFISNGPLISWMYPVLGIRGASWFLGISEWLFGALIFIGFLDNTLGALGAAGAAPVVI